MSTRETLLCVLLWAGAAHATPALGTVPVREDPAPPAGAALDLWKLLAPRAGAQSPDETALARQVARLGTGVIQPALAVYLGEIDDPDMGYDVDGRVIEARPRILLSALKLLPRAAVLAEIDRAVLADEDVDRRLDLARVLSLLGGEEALRRIVAIAEKLDPLQWERTFVQVPLQQGMSGIVRAEPKLGVQLAARVRQCQPALAAILARTLADAGAAQTAAELARALGRDARLDLCLAEVLATLGDEAAGMLPEPALEALRRMLDKGDPRVARAAALALARLGDAECAARLVALLGHPDQTLSSAAWAALKTLGSTGLSNERAAWERWLEGESTWAAERLPEIERSLADADAASVAQAVSELRKHRLYRHRAALALATALDSEDPAVVRLACVMLPGFASRAVVPALRAVVQDGSEEEREAAANALRILTGEEAAAPAATPPSPAPVPAPGS